METTQVNKIPHPLMWVAGIAIILFCAAGTAAIMGWIPTSMGGPGDKALEKPLVGAAQPATAKAKAHAAPVHVASNTPATAKCAECGVIESTRDVDTKGEGSGLGAAGGAVVGGVLGSQIGHGSGAKIATVIGAVGGAVAGNEIEKRVKTSKSYEVTVRMDDGSSRVIHEASAPTWRAGDHVKIIDGAIRSI